MFRLLAQGKYYDALTDFDRYTRDHRIGVKWDVRRLAKRWQKINSLAAMEPPVRRSARLAHEAARLRKLPPAVARMARSAGAAVSRHGALAAVACVLLAIIGVFSAYPTAVSAKNATALTPPGTGGIMATKALLRSELSFTLRSATARSHFDEAEKALSQGKFAEAARSYEISGEAVDTLAAKLNFGIALYNTSDLPKAASIFSAGLGIARKKNIAVLQAAFLTNLGNVRREQGRLDEAARLYRDAEEIDRGTDALGWATTAYNYGVLCDMLGNFSVALSQFDIARQGYRQLGNELGEADTLVRRAGSLRIILEAESYESEDLRAAARLYQQIPGPLAEASYHFAVGYRELDEGFDHRDKASLERAVDEFKRAYGTYESIGYRRGQADVMCSLGNAYREEPDSLDARIAYGGCLSIAIKIGSPFMQAIGYSSVGIQQITSGKVSNGLENLTLALRVAQEIGARGIEVTVLEEIGGEYARRGELAVALSYYEKAVKTAENVGDPYLLIQAVRAPNYRTLGDAAKTIGALVRLRDLYAAVGNTTRSAEVQREIDQLRK
jgi:tetratricopeptide (TPR) repeat protein